MRQLLSPKRLVLAGALLVLVAIAIGVGSAVASYRFAHRFGAITVKWNVTTL